jgi:hypothetical protein
MREGIHDYVAAICWLINPWNGRPDFARVLNRWTEWSAGRHVYTGVAAYRKNSAGSWIICDSSRAAGLQGQAFFRLESIKPASLHGGRYRMQANIPPMKWKDAVPPNPVEDLTVTETARGVYRIQWARPPRAADGDTARYYNVYRWTAPHIPLHLPDARLIITSPGVLSIVDSTATEGRTRFFYAVAAFDRANNESAPSPVVSTHSEPMFAQKDGSAGPNPSGSTRTGGASTASTSSNGRLSSADPSTGAAPSNTSSSSSTSPDSMACLGPTGLPAIAAPSGLAVAPATSGSLVPPPPAGPSALPVSPVPADNVSLTVRLSNDTGRPSLVQYSLPVRTRVALDIILRRGGIPDTLHAMLVRAVQEQGSYKVNLNKVNLPAGSYILRLTTENNTVEQGLTVEQ